MVKKMGKGPSEHGQLTKIRPSDGCRRDAVPLALGLWYDFHGFGSHLLMWTAPDGIKRVRHQNIWDD